MKRKSKVETVAEEIFNAVGVGVLRRKQAPRAILFTALDPESRRRYLDAARRHLRQMAAIKK